MKLKLFILSLTIVVLAGIIYFEFNDEDAEIIVTKNKKSDYFYLNAI